MLKTEISWCDHTINWWHGCSKVSPACQNCYAEALDARFHREPHWGPDAPRLLRVPQALAELAKIRRRAIKTGQRPRVFVNSMSDFFEDRRDLDTPRFTALDCMRQSPEVDFLLLTKRPDKISILLRVAHEAIHSIAQDGLPSPYMDWLSTWINGTPPKNIWLGITCENQEWANKRIPELLKVPAAVRFLSVEPMLGPMEFSDVGKRSDCVSQLGKRALDGIHWVICGGESGRHARPMHPDWARGLRDQCAAAGVAFHFKQWGEFGPMGNHGCKAGDWAVWPDGNGVVLNGLEFPTTPSAAIMRRVGKTAAGRFLDGREHNEFPETK